MAAFAMDRALEASGRDTRIKIDTTFVDRFIAWLMPERGARRLAARAATQRFAWEAGKTDRRQSGWTTTHKGPNAELKAVNARIRDHAREAFQNNPYARKGVRSLVNYGVGSGIRPRTRNGRLRSAWEIWVDECDAGGRLDYYGLQRLATQSMVVDGEVLVRRRVRLPEDGLHVPLQIELLEVDMLDSNVDGTSSADGGFAIQGIQFDALGRATAYHLFEKHPGEDSGFSARKSSRSHAVPASEIIHLFEPLRPGQVRGVSWLAASLMAMRDEEDFMSNEMLRKKLETCIVGVVHRAPSALGLIGSALQGTTLKEADGSSKQEIEPGLMMDYPDGTHVEFNNPTYSPNLEAFESLAHHRIAAGMGSTYMAMTGNLRGTTYSSSRWGNKDLEASIQPLQKTILVPQFCRRTWSWFTESAIIAGRAARPDRNVMWSCPSVPDADPLKEATSRLMRMRMGDLLLEDQVGKSGRDLSDHLQRLARTNTLLDDLEIILDSDPRYRTRTGAAMSNRGVENEPTDDVVPGEEETTNVEEDEEDAA